MLKMDVCASLNSVVNVRIEKSTNVHWEDLQNYKGQKEKFVNAMICRNNTRKRIARFSIRIELIEGLSVKYANAVEYKVPA
jgi:hypothetical protein